MSYESACNTLEIRFATIWGSTSSIGYENDGQTPPSTGNYVTLQFEGSGKGRQASIGSAINRFRDLNFLNIIVHAPKGSGPHTLRALIDTAISIFRGYRSTGITCKTPTPVGPQDEDEKWVKQLIIVPWTYDEYA